MGTALDHRGPTRRPACKCSPSLGRSLWAAALPISEDEISPPRAVEAASVFRDGQSGARHFGGLAQRLPLPPLPPGAQR
jgi:hypothetical protein